jgi:tetratricopeptide (TPR) repeat protein
MGWNAAAGWSVMPPVRAFVLVGCLLAGSRGLASGEATEATAQMALNKIEKRDYRAAMKIAGEVLRDRSASPLARHAAQRALGLAQLRLAMIADAHATLLAALSETPDEPFVIAGLGETEEALGEHTHAKERLEALRASGQLPDFHAHLALAHALYALGDVNAARAELDEAIALAPDDAAVLGFKTKMDRSKRRHD